MSQARRNIPSISIFDNDVTLLYKWANYYEVPIKQIVVRPRTEAEANVQSGSKTWIYEPLNEMIRRLSGQSLYNIYEQVVAYSNDTSADDVAMTYADLINPSYRDQAMKTVNDFYADLEPGVQSESKRFPSLSEFNIFLDTWHKSTASQRQHDSKYLETILGVEAELLEISKQPPVLTTPPSIGAALLAFVPKLNKAVPRLIDGIDIFNSSVASQFVPFIQYNSADQKYYKVFRGDNTGQEPNYNVTILSNTQTRRTNAIFMILWLGDPLGEGNQTIYNSPNDMFVRVEYYLESNYLTVNTSSNENNLDLDERIAAQRIQQALPTLLLGQPSEAKVRGKFDVLNVRINDVSFIDMILNDPLFSIYLYIEESIRPYALKRRLDIHFRSLLSDQTEGDTPTDEAYISNSASVSATLINKQALADELVDVLQPDNQVIKMNMLKDTQYIRVNITRADSRRAVNEFLLIFRLLLRNYVDNEAAIRATYETLIPEIAELPHLIATRRPNQVIKQKEERVSRNSRIQQLRERAPEIFVENYARRCQCRLQPIIIEPSEVEFWRTQRILVNGVPTDRQIMPFPKDSPRYLFVCPGDDSPFPGVKLSKDLANKDQYPYVPCCFKKDQTDAKTSTRYNEYYRGYPSKLTKGAKADTTIKTDKLLSSGATGQLPSSIVDVLKLYSTESNEMIRLGVPRSINSLLHCICIAIDDPNYLNSLTDQARENYVTKIRQYILGTIPVPVYRQELYDRSEIEIKTMLADNDLFLDPFLFFRGAEELFKINIFVFNPPDPTDKDDIGRIEIPRHKLFHARPPRNDRPTILILKHFGSESDALTYPQCELIVDFIRRDSAAVKMFGFDMSEHMRDVLSRTLSTITWTFQEGELQPNRDIYSALDYYGILGRTATSQYIDGYGKCRAFVCPVNIDGVRSEITVVIPPTQPEALPLVSRLPPCDGTIPIRIFGKQPSTRSVDGQGRTTGLWFSVIDLTEGIYVPINPTVSYNTTPIGSNDPLMVVDGDVTGRFKALQRTLDVFLQLVRWMYDIYRKTNVPDVNTFFIQYFVANTASVSDSAGFYDLSKLPRHLPPVTTVSAAIQHIEQYAPSMIASDRVLLYDNDFTVRMYRYLQRYNNQTIGGPSIPEPVINNYYQEVTDFTTNPDVNIFIGERDLGIWLATNARRPERFYAIRNKVDLVFSLLVEPYIYQHTDGRIFLIQNVANGSRDSAFAVALAWHTSKINLGFNAKPSNQKPVHLIYGISPSGSLVPIEDHREKSQYYVQLLNYSGTSTINPRYAALLDIL